LTRRWGPRVVGFTIEYDARLFFRRAEQLQFPRWDGPYLEELVAASISDEP
jgi:hypothetical protein